jgi:hypothetical protein
MISLIKGFFPIWRVRNVIHSFSILPTAGATIVLFLIFSTVIGMGQQGVTISGNLIVNKYDEFGRPESLWCSTNVFQMALDVDGRYVIEVDPINNLSNFMCLTYNGNDTFYVEDRKPTDGKVHNAYVSSGRYPFCPWDDQKRVSVLWLAYASGNYIHELGTNTMPLPWISARSSLSAFGFRTKSEFLPESSYVLSHLEFIRDDSLDLSTFDAELNRPEIDFPSDDVEAASLKADLEDRKINWKNGLVAGDLLCSMFTNKGGLQFPLSFTFTSYHAYHKLVNRQVVGFVTNIDILHSNEQFSPPVISRLRVEDSRFRALDLGVESINYQITNINMWRSTNDQQLIEEFSAVKVNALDSGHFKASAVHDKRVAMVVVVLLIGSTLPLILYLRSRNKGSGSHAHHDEKQ